ncbi:MAG: flavoprotein [Planctomycetota bacterium]|jgi:phosphopantothenoylcysteine decarboxylase/phosphopantothenate--cysteine ligase
MNILLAVSGGIAAYKAPELVRRLRESGHQVRCMLTNSATRFVTTTSLGAVSGAAVHTSMWTDDGTMPHIDLARWADALLIAPATANVLARISLGLADDLVTTMTLALDDDKPLVIAPAMNSVMWGKPIVQQHITALRARDARIIDPIDGELACGEIGAGKMAEVPDIVTVVNAL